LKESIIDGKTGILIDPLCSSENIKDAVNNIAHLNISQETCTERASDFDLKNFTKELKAIISE
jgi:glycosyltransferase involved in cell wall biosynthesis